MAKKEYSHNYHVQVSRSGCSYYVENYEHPGSGVRGTRRTLAAAERLARKSSLHGEAFVMKACDSKRLQRRRIRTVRHCKRGVCEKV